jgi:AAA ATPase domain
MPGHTTAPADVAADQAFVGRHQELAAIDTAVASARQSRARVVWIEGDPGSGKTALLRQALAALPEGFSVTRAEADELAEDAPFYLVAQLGVAGATAAFPAGLELLQRWGQWQEQGPVAVVIEDLHWADARSRVALLGAVRRLGQDRVLVLVTSRPGPVVADGWDRAADIVGGRARLAHLVAAADSADDALADQVDDTAEDEASRAHFAVAAKHLLWASQLSSDRNRAEDRLLRAAQLFLAAEQTAQVESLRPRLEDCTASPLRALVLGMLAWDEGDGVAAERLLTEAAGCTAREDPLAAAEADRRAIADAWARLAFLYTTQVRAGPALDAARKELALAPPPDVEHTATLAAAAGEAIRHGAPAGLDRLAQCLPAAPGEVEVGEVGHPAARRAAPGRHRTAPGPGRPYHRAAGPAECSHRPSRPGTDRLPAGRRWPWSQRSPPRPGPAPSCFWPLSQGSR